MLSIFVTSIHAPRRRLLIVARSGNVVRKVHPPTTHIPIMIAGIVACADVGGFYQKLHQTPPVESLAGAYMVSVQSRFAAVSPIVLAGSANGSAFHTVHGTFDRSGSRLTVAFPSGLMNGTLADERITWDGGDVWLLQAAPAFQLAGPLDGKLTERRGSLGGLFTDPAHYQAGSFAGTSLVSFDEPHASTDRTGSPSVRSFTMVGSNDGLDFWSVRGNFSPASGAVVLDLSPLGGAASVGGAFANGTLRLGAAPHPHPHPRPHPHPHPHPNPNPNQAGRAVGMGGAGGCGAGGGRGDGVRGGGDRGALLRHQLRAGEALRDGRRRVLPVGHVLGHLLLGPRAAGGP